MVVSVDAYAPDDEADYNYVSEICRQERRAWLTRAEQRSRIREPQTHLRDADAVILSGEFHDDIVAQTARTEDLGEERAEQQTEEQQPLDLRRVLRVRGGEHGDDGEDPPVPGEAVGQDAHDYDWVFECEDEARE